ncbi:hypothetical protein AGMMS49545_21670 [Betaproteobacteria bacterium]|nr:hypothetical protein AGMMS49545_21670 [Betaproteobacteria bacterium]GHU47678.1 hypothetical protein AGMMS50289_23210 [Betaproteobacteria bacterium]
MTKILTRDDIESICLVLISLLLAASIICSFGIGERVYAACFYAWNFPDAWKYYGHKAWLGINADMSITALFFCLFGATVSLVYLYCGRV